MKKGLLVLSLFFGALVQTPVAAMIADSVVFLTSRVTPWRYISPELELYFDPSGSADFQDRSRLIKAPYDCAHIPLENTPYPHYFFVDVRNDERDTTSFFLYKVTPGEMTVRQVTDSGMELRPVEADLVKSTILFQKGWRMVLPPGAVLHYAVRINPVQDIYFKVYVYLVEASRLEQFFRQQSGSHWFVSMENMMVIGMMLMMLLYILVKYVQIRSSVYLFYAGYIFFFFLFFLFRELATWNMALRQAPLYYAYGEQMFQIAAYTLYFPFAQRFLNTKVIIPKLHRWMTRIVWVLIAYMVADLVLLYIPSTMLFRWQLWDTVRIFLLASVLIITILLLRAKSPYIRFLVIGSAMLAFFAMLSMIFSTDEGVLAGLPPGLNQSVTYFYIGVVLEILFFSTVLGYKHRRDEIQRVQAEEALKREAERYQFQQYRLITEALEGERGRIAKDLHDGLGGMLSGVKFSLGNIKNKIELSNDQGALYERALDQLGGSIRELRRVAHDMMPDILVNQGLSAAVGNYCASLNSMEVLEIVFQSAGEEKRSDMFREIIIYRIVQELITNVIRHAEATTLVVQLVFNDRQLAITIEDNGRGFDQRANTSKKGIGLSNVKARVDFLKGSISIDSVGDAGTSGTSVFMEIPLPEPDNRKTGELANKA